MDEVTPEAGTPQQMSQFGPVLTWTRRLLCLTIAVIGVCAIWKLGGRLAHEAMALRADWLEARDRDPMGYIEISSREPEVKPPSCIREDNGRVLLWAGSGTKGQAGWFDATGVDMPLKQFRFAFGRDRIRAIDYPIFQDVDGEIVRKMYPERPVIGLAYQGEARAYPLTVMRKVEVVNETIQGDAIAVTWWPLLEQGAIYDRTLDGEQLSFGTSGYCYQDKFVLYDRGTDSLWYPMDGGLTAISGKLVGKVLRVIEPPNVVEWRQWRRQHPDTKVLVGADRSRGIPVPTRNEVASAEVR